MQPVVIPLVVGCLFVMNIFGSGKDLHLCSFFCVVRSIIVGKAKWQPLNMLPHLPSLLIDSITTFLMRMAEISVTLTGMKDARPGVPIICPFSSQLWLNIKSRWILEAGNGLWQTQPNSSLNCSCYVWCSILAGEMNTALDTQHEASDPAGGITAACIRVGQTVVHIYVIDPDYINSPTLYFNIIWGYLENKNVPQNIILVHYIYSFIWTRPLE